MNQSWCLISKNSLLNLNVKKVNFITNENCLCSISLGCIGIHDEGKNWKHNCYMWNEVLLE